MSDPMNHETAVRNALARISWDMPGKDIECESFRRIEAECAQIQARLPRGCWTVARRLIHTTADTGIAQDLSFRHAPLEAGVAALLSGAPILCDSSMIRAGLSVPRLKLCHPSYGPEKLCCHIVDADVAGEAQRLGRTRAICAMEKALRSGEADGAVVLIGNAPLALARLAKAVLEGTAHPALVVGMPVGFVNVLESKALLALCETPQIVLEGRRGGSPLAVATLHALIEVALERPGAVSYGQRHAR